jgi:hypothetical protein
MTFIKFLKRFGIVFSFFIISISLVQANVLYEKGFEIIAEKRPNPNNCELRVKIKNRYDNVPQLTFVVNVIDSKGVNVTQIPFIILDIKKNQLYERVYPTGVPCFNISKFEIKLI